MRVLIASATLLAALIVGGASCGNKSKTAEKGAAQAEKKTYKTAPDFTLLTTNGDSLTLSSLRGKIVLLNFWATWCPPCKAEIPGFIELQKTYADSGFTVVGVSVDDDRGQVPPYVKAKGVNYPMLYADGSVTKDYGGVNAIPTTFILDKEGRIRQKVIGLRPDTFFESKVKELLAE